jgi:hypothetical protein
MDDISELIPFSRLRQLRTRDVSEPINEVPSSDNLLVYEGLISIYEYISEHEYFLLNQRCVAKLNQKFDIDDVLYKFTVLDLWSEKEM